jgi:hypothetical protein
MPKRIQVWPPAGGEPIEIWEADKFRFLEKGWLDVDPATVVKPAVATATISDAEEINNGNIYRKRRNSKSRV